ncbi:MAG TPA: lipoyl(octanoyl) transferase LipB [Rubricoccaceae bacterium]|nr:lipoyl(octanoyl) transferase LipB [Rubricoccaceae bacterium]
MPPPEMNPVVVCPVGRMDYPAAWALQRRVHARLVAAKRSAAAAALPHVLLLVEHPPVFTLGPSGDAAHVLLSEAALAARGATFVRTDRGGDVTFHGPGQLVAYPILDLDRLRYPDGGRGTDVHRYLRELEEAVIGACADYGLAAGRVPGRTGVWIGPDARGPERKVCAFGIRCSRWVTMHGLAFNLNTDLGWFGAIVPCGIADRGVTSLAQELGRPVDEEEATGRFLAHFAAQFGATLSRRAPAEAAAWLDAFAPEALPSV